METFTFFIVGFACILGVAVLLLLISFISLRKKHQNLYQHLTITESELIRTKESLHHFEKKLLKNQEHSNTNHNHQNEILDLRKDNAHFKDEIKKLKDDVRIKNIEMKKLEALHIDKLFLITKEKETLLAQLKEIDSSYKRQKDELEKTIHELNIYGTELHQKALTSEKQSKSNISKLITLQSKLKVAEQEIGNLSHVIAEKSKVTDESSIEIWKERAQSAKKMYQLMKQTRELSDNKVQSYQEGIVVTAEWILKNTNTPLPNVAENENKADRLLAEAWAAIIARSPLEPPAPFESGIETRV